AVSGARDRKPRKQTPRSGSAAGKKPYRGASKRAETGDKSRTGKRVGTGRSGRKYDSTDGKAATRTNEPAAKKKLPASASGLPRHVVEALQRVTPPARQNAALVTLAAAAEAFTEGQYHLAARKATEAKELSSRDATIREVLALASYRIGDWQTALRELRTYRRLSGETTHMPVEMDVLRAMGRGDDVAGVWDEFHKHGGSPAATKEARVVYASYLIDQDDLGAAADVIGKARVIDDPWPEDMRLWYVEARLAALRGNHRRAQELADAILLEDPSFPGLDELDRLINSARS
ncbi:MAG: hypothetical protein WBV06_19905, partial [Acidimicrobiia bacterium]